MIYDKSETACLTGHRPKNLPWHYDETKDNCVRFKNDLREILERAIKYGLKNFLIGMAEGFDMIAAELLLKLRRSYGYIKIIAVIPFVGQERMWQSIQRERYHKILKQCDDKIILSQKYTDDCLNDRNKFMVENSSVIIACHNGKPSGTGNTIKYGRRSSCKIKIININNYVE